MFQEAIERELAKRSDMTGINENADDPFSYSRN